MRQGMRARAAARWGMAAALAVLAAACAARVAPPLPAVLAYPGFVYPAVPAEFGAAAADAVEGGWRFLQNGDLPGAARTFAAAGPAGFYPARTGEGWVALARGDYEAAAGAFDVALGTAPAYAPALAGRGQAMLALGRNADALSAFESALAADPSLSGLAQRVDVLRVRVLQEVIDQARGARAAGRLEESRDAYRRAIDASERTAFLHRELGEVERERGDLDAALTALTRAVELDGSDAEALAGLGDVFEARGAYTDAAAAYERASALAPGAPLADRLAASLARVRDAMLPGPFQAIPSAATVTRGDLAALIGVRLDGVLAGAAPVQVVVTDIQRHWAETWIAAVIRAGVIDEFPNHTFQPDAVLRRVDLAAAARRVVALLAAGRPGLQAVLAARPAIADVDPAHLNYPDVAVAVAAGVLPLADGRFGVNRTVSGAEAVEAIARLRALAEGR